MIIASIVLTDEKNAIGKNNQLIHRLPAYLRFFQDTTMGFPIIMGRKTYESVWHLLPGRKNIIITRKSGYTAEGAEVYNNVTDALNSCNDKKVFIIGGAEIFREAMSMTTEIYHTLIRAHFDSDTFFPEILDSDFDLVQSECCYADADNRFDYCFQKWERRPVKPRLAHAESSQIPILQ